MLFGVMEVIGDSVDSGPFVFSGSVSLRDDEKLIVKLVPVLWVSSVVGSKLDG